MRDRGPSSSLCIGRWDALFLWRDPCRARVQPVPCPALVGGRCAQAGVGPTVCLGLTGRLGACNWHLMPIQKHIF